MIKFKPKGTGRQLIGDTIFGSFSMSLQREASDKKLRIVDESGTEVGTAEMIMKDPEGAKVQNSKECDVCSRARKKLE